MKTLHLNLKKKWFDMILSGEKKEEYREIKDYWMGRFVYCIYSADWSSLSHVERVKNHISLDKIQFHVFNTITFSNGYSKDRDQFEIKFKGFEIREGKKEWGAEEGKKYFVLKLGKIVSPNLINHQ